MFPKYDLNVFEIEKQVFKFLDKVPIDTKILIIIILLLLVSINIGNSNDIE
jgi:hypothetical protein